VRAVFNVNAKAMQMLPSDGEPFSIRRWVKGTCEPGSLLFLSARYVDMSVLSQLLTLWLDTAINTLMTGRRTRDLKLWFLIDELGALHRLPSLEKGLQTARNFGGAIVTGVHAFAKLKEVYGENMAMTLSSLARTKLILATADRETATWCSDVVGHREVREMEEGYSYGYNNARDAVSLTPRRQVVPLLLPDEFMELPSLSGFIKFPDGFPAAPVTLAPREWPRVAEGFIAREMPSRSGAAHRSNSDPSDTQGNAEHRAGSDDEGGEPRRLARKDRPSVEPQKAPSRSNRAAQSNAPKSGKNGEQASVTVSLPADPASVARLASRSNARPETGTHAQSESPLGEARESTREPAGLTDKPSRPDIPDPQAAQDAARDRNRTDQRQQEDQQRALLGGAAREQQERDLGDIGPDI